MLAGAEAAKRLAEACGRPAKGGTSLRRDAVRDLAKDLESHLAGLASMDAHPSLLAEAAQRCSDLATLAACNADGLDDPSAAAEAVRLASEAAKSLSLAVEESSPEDLARRDARSASWKASLAARNFEDIR